MPEGLLIVACLSLTFNPYVISLAQDQVLILEAGRPVLLSLEETMSSERASVGDLVKLRVVRAVKVNDIVVIAAGAKATGKVSEVKHKGGFGKKGEIALAVSSVTAVDGQEVPLSATQRREGESRGGTAVGTAVITGVLC